MSRIRTFIAVDINESIRGRLASLQETLGRTGTDVKWVEVENLHVTLLFLGEVDDRDLMPVCRAVADCCKDRQAFSLSVEKVGCFPNPRRPRILWAGIGQGTQEIVALHDALEPPLLELGCYRREERQYTPHLTIGRLKSEKVTFKLSEAIAKHQGWKGGETMVREVLVMASKLTPDGPEYTVMSRAKFGDAS